jgi:hypothetical protein
MRTVTRRDRETMNTLSGIARHFGIAAATGVLLSGAAHGQANTFAPPADDATSSRPFDWIGHTAATLEGLKTLLHLETAQLPAWNTWSGGVLQDAHRQAGPKAPPNPEAEKAATGYLEPTPARMARGIAHLRARLAWMEDHLVELEAAQIRTQAFYEGLDIKQKTVFDLYWHEVRHRVSGEEADWDMRGDMHGDMRSNMRAPLHAGGGMGAMMGAGENAEGKSMMPPHAEPQGERRAP